MICEDCKTNEPAKWMRYCLTCERVVCFECECEKHEHKPKEAGE